MITPRQATGSGKTDRLGRSALVQGGDTTPADPRDARVTGPAGSGAVAESAPIAAAARAGAIFRNAAVGIAITDLEGRLRECNPAYGALLGYSRDELRRTAVEELVDPRDLESERAAIRRLEAGEVSSIEVESRHMHRKGHEIRVRKVVSLLPADAGGPPQALAIAADVTGERHAQAVLRESQEMLQSFYDMSPFMMGVAELDGDTIVAVHGNEAAGGFLGLTPDQLMGRTAQEISRSEEIVRLWREHYLRSQRERTAVRFEYEHPRPDGTVVSLRATVAWLGTSASGRPRFSFVAEDVTERHDSERALRHGEVRQGFLLQLGDSIRGLTDPRKVMSITVEQLGRHLGVDRVNYAEIDGAEEFFLVEGEWTAAGVAGLKGRHPVAGFGPALLAEVRAGRAIRFDDALALPDSSDPAVGAVFAAAGIRAGMAVPLVEDGRLRATLNVHHGTVRRWTDDDEDLVREVAERTWAAVERARAEEALRESQERLQLALDAAEMGTYVWHVADDRGEPDARTLALFGRAPGMPLDLAVALAALHPDDRDAARRAIARATDPAGDGSLHMEVRVVHPDGAVRWLALASQTFFEGLPRRAVRLYGVAWDVTARKRREQREREFVANAAHELRTPVTGIGGAVAALRRGAVDVPAERDRFLAHLSRQSERLARLTDSLLLLAQADAHAGAPMSPVTVRDALREVALDLPVAEGVDVTVRASPSLAVLTNPGLLERILANLAENAAKHTKQGRIELVARAARERVVVEVRDSGPGMSEATAEHAFDRFYRDQGGDGDGFGLGLSIARQAALAIGGELALAPSPTGGTIARLILPRLPGA